MSNPSNRYSNSGLEVGPAVGRVWAHISGLPTSKGLRRQLMVLQAYIDDSMEAGEVLVFAGYIASYEKWLAFTNEWQERLDMRPHWTALKMSEVAASGSPERWERAGWFYRVIEDHVQAFVVVALEIEPLRRVRRELGLPEVFENPYAVIYRMIIDAVAQFQDKLGISEPVDFIFDKHGQAKQVLMGYDIMMEHSDLELRSRLGKMPRFEDDKEFLPLQAADLLAWFARKHWVANRSITTKDIGVAWEPRVPILGFRANFGYEDIKANYLVLRDRLLAAGVIGPRMTIAVTFTGLDGRKF